MMCFRTKKTKIAEHSTSKPLTKLRATLTRSIKVYEKFIAPFNLFSLSSSVDMLSLHANQLLVGSKVKVKNQLSIFSTDGTLINSITKATACIDAMWTQKHQIVCTTKSGIELVDPANGNILASHSVTINGYSVIGISSDDIIYVSTSYEGIFTTRDDGLSWSAVKQLPQPTDSFARLQYITFQLNDTFWSLENNALLQTVRVLIYYNNGMSRVIHERPNGLFENSVDAKIYRLIGAVQLGAVLMTDELNNAVHVFNTAGDPEGQLTLSHVDGLQGPCSVAIDNEILYLGMEDGSVQVFTLSRY